ncbi:MAG: hypothetical protein WBL80_02865 [Erysipelotrichaceae bacterium]
MSYKALMAWLKTEFPQLAWSSSQLFGKECIAASIKHARIFIKIRKNSTFGIDFDNRDHGFDKECLDHEALKTGIVECINDVDPKLLVDVQPSLL